MIKIFCILAFISSIFISCSNKNSEVTDTSTADDIYADTINFRYESVKQKAILLDGFLEDSITVNIFFDTGQTIAKIITTDSLKQYLPKCSIASLHIGYLTDTMPVKYYPKEHFFFQNFGSNAVSIGWNFFKDRIIRISYKDKQIQEIEDISKFTDQYSRIKIEKTDWNGLFIPVTVYLQGKQITKKMLIDTGNNGAIDFGRGVSKEYAIDTDGAHHVISQYVGGSTHKYFIPADSIKIGNNMVPIPKNVGFSIDRDSSPLLGNEILDQFDIIFDFKDFNLYIKPN